jgi:phage-related baseplate assembly protein
VSTIDLSLLPAPQALQPVDFEATFAGMLDSLRTYDPEFTTISEFDPAYKLLQVAAYWYCNRIEAANNDARALLLAFATEGDLDHIGVTYFGGTERKTIKAADPLASPPTAAVMETDDDYRRRLLLYPHSTSVAGPSGAYEFLALSAHSNVADASATSPAPAQVVVTVLGRSSGGVPDADTLAAVTAALDAESVRPVADRVTVQPASIVTYSITAAVLVPTGPDASAISSTIASNIATYKDTPRRLGRDIARSALYAALHIAGVERVELTDPAADILLDDTQASLCTAISITVNGAPVEISA